VPPHQASVALNDKIMSTRTVLASRYEAIDPEQRRLLEEGGRKVSEVLSSAAPLVDEGVRQASPHVTKAIKATTKMGAKFARVELVKKVDEIDAYLMREDPAYVPPPGGTLFARLPGGGGGGLGSGGRSGGSDSVVSEVSEVSAVVSEVGGGSSSAVEVTKSAAEVVSSAVSSAMASTAATVVAAAPAPPAAPTVMVVEAQAVAAQAAEATVTSTTMASQVAEATVTSTSDETAASTTMASSDETATSSGEIALEIAISKADDLQGDLAEEATPSAPKTAPQPSAGMVRFIQTFAPIQAASASDEAAMDGAMDRDQSAAAADENEGSYDDADYAYEE
jgi:hypothetical protein